MPEKISLTSLIIGATDDLAHIQNLHELLKICLRGLETPDQLREEVLLSSYLEQSKPYLEKLQTELEEALEIVSGSSRHYHED